MDDPDHALWPFDDPQNVAVLTVSSILDRRAPILFVSHDEEDGGWQFLDGSVPDEPAARVVALRRIWHLDPSIGELADLPLGWCAWRERADGPWTRAPQKA